jgi:hypothetical protein
MNVFCYTILFETCLMTYVDDASRPEIGRIDRRTEINANEVINCVIKN